MTDSQKKIKLPCKGECTLPRGGEHCKSCGLKLYARYNWQNLTIEQQQLENELRLKRIKGD